MPEVSVVISTFNGAEGLDRCLRSLARQTIAQAMEVIVVDDGSTDNSAEVARTHGARVIRHAQNAGLSAARNSGVLAATAPIVAFTDDDCEPEPDWLENLLAGHGPGVIGVGGHVVAEGSGFFGRYVRRHNPIAAREIEVAHSEAAVYRLRLYLAHLWTEQVREGRRPMHSLCGANMSFPRHALLEAGLFDTGFTRAADDLDLCTQLAKIYPHGQFLLEPKARVVHHFTPSLRDTAKRARSYGRADARMFRKWPATPLTVFFYPFVWLGLVSLAIRRRAILPLTLASPLAMFPAGIRNAMRTRTPECLVDPFVQLTQEAAWDIGFFEGVWRYRDLVPAQAQASTTTADPSNPTAGEDFETAESASPSDRHALPPAAPPGPPSRAGRFTRTTMVFIACLGLMALLVPAHRSWVAQTILLGLLLIVPGLLALRALRVPGAAVAAFPVYVPCASMAVLMCAGLVVDVIGPAIGVAQPLRPGPLLVGIEIFCLILLALGRNAPPESGIPWGSLQVRLRDTWPLVLPALAAAGAARLTGGHGAATAIVSTAAAGTTLVLTTVFAGRLSRAQLALVLYGVALALMWSFSLRSHFVYGFDIAKEYQVLSSTYSAGVWQASHAHNAYQAMLSLTVLPSSLHAITGLSVLAILKVVYPALFALFPVALFGLAGRFLRPKYAFIAAAFIIVQPYFSDEVPALARQEIALLFFVALLGAILDTRPRGRAPWTLIVLLVGGVVVSHYTTTYITIAILAAGAALQVAVAAVRRAPPATRQVLIALVASVAGAALWYGAVTHSAANVSGFAASVQERGLDLLPSASQGKGFLGSYLSGNVPSRISAQRYQALSVRYAQRRPYIHPLAAAARPRYALRNANVPGDKVHVAAASSGLGIAEVVVEQIFNLLAIVGAVILALRRRERLGVRLVGFLGSATLLVLAFVRLSGTAAAAYNQERALVQTIVLLGICAAWVLQWSGERRQWCGRVIPALAALALAAVFVSSSGLRAVAFGGARDVNLSTHGEAYERFFVTPAELGSARWLGAKAPAGSLIYADRYGALRVIAATGRGVLDDPAPSALDQHAWLYESASNVLDGRGRGEFDNNYALYAWPGQFLKDQFNTVYTNGSSEVLHR